MFERATLCTCAKEEGLEWVEDSSNMLPIFSRNYIRKLLADDPELTQGLRQLYASLSDARSTLNSRGMQAELETKLAHA